MDEYELKELQEWMIMLAAKFEEINGSIRVTTPYNGYSKLILLGDLEIEQIDSESTLYMIYILKISSLHTITIQTSKEGEIIYCEEGFASKFDNRSTGFTFKEGIIDSIVYELRREHCLNGNYYIKIIPNVGVVIFQENHRCFIAPYIRCKFSPQYEVFPKTTKVTYEKIMEIETLQETPYLDIIDMNQLTPITYNDSGWLQYLNDVFLPVDARNVTLKDLSAEEKDAMNYQIAVLEKLPQLIINKAHDYIANIINGLEETKNK